jgi:hypothetical protein
MYDICQLSNPSTPSPVFVIYKTLDKLADSLVFLRQHMGHSKESHEFKTKMMQLSLKDLVRPYEKYDSAIKENRDSYGASHQVKYI